MSAKTRIAVVGSLNVDLVSLVSHVPSAGETISSEAFSTNGGGKGANQAVAAAKLSGDLASVTMIGAVGNDQFGRMVLDNLVRVGVDVSDVSTIPEVTTGVAVILVERKTGENRIIISPGANAFVLPSSLPTRLFAHDRPSLFVLQLEIPLPTVLDVIQRASTCQPPIPVLLNPAPAVPLPDFVYSLIDYLVLNETEASTLSGIQFPAVDQNDTTALERASHDFEAKSFESIDWFASKGSKNVVITLGALGAAFFQASTKTKRRIPAQKAKAVDTTAAGDTFIGALAVQLVKTPPGSEARLDLAVEEAVRASAWTVERRGTWDAMPTWDDLRSSAMSR